VTPCSQYEQHVRAICELPLAQPRMLANAIMMNVLGDGTGDHPRASAVWLTGVHAYDRTQPGVEVHLATSADQLAARGLPPSGAAVIVGLGLALWLLIVLIVTATSSSGQLTESQLRPGDCLRNSTNLGPSLGNDGPWPSTFTAVPCAMPHVAEIIFAGDPWPQSLAYPGFAVIANQGPARCASAFRAYDGIAPAASEFSIADITPDSSTWASGDRLVVCIAYVSDFSGPSYGGDLWDYSIKESHR